MGSVKYLTPKLSSIEAYSPEDCCQIEPDREKMIEQEIERINDILISQGKKRIITQLSDNLRAVERQELLRRYQIKWGDRVRLKKATFSTFFESLDHEQKMILLVTFMWIPLIFCYLFGLAETGYYLEFQ